MNSLLLRGHVLVSVCSQVIVERGADNALQENSGCVRSACVDLGACQVSVSYGQTCELCRLSLAWRPFAKFNASNMGAPRGISPPLTAELSQHEQSSFDFDTGNHKNTVCRVVRSPSNVHSLGFISSPALLSAVVRLSKLLLGPARLSFPHREVMSVGQIRCLVFV